MVAALGGFVVRLALLTAVVILVKDQPWVDLVALCLTLVVTHLGLLIWETRHVSASLAFPALKPAPPSAGRKPHGRRPMITILALEFPPIGHLVEWEGLFLKGTPFEVNKVVLLMWAGVLIVVGLFCAAGRKAKSATGNLVPGRRAERRRVGHRVRPQGHHPADDGQRRPGLRRRSSPRCSSSSSSPTCSRSSPASSSR